MMNTKRTYNFNSHRLFKKYIRNLNIGTTARNDRRKYVNHNHIITIIIIITDVLF